MNKPKHKRIILTATIIGYATMFIFFVGGTTLAGREAKAQVINHTRTAHCENQLQGISLGYDLMIPEYCADLGFGGVAVK